MMENFIKIVGALLLKFIITCRKIKDFRKKLIFDEMVFLNLFSWVGESDELHRVSQDRGEQVISPIRLDDHRLVGFFSN